MAATSAAAAAASAIAAFASSATRSPFDVLEHRQSERGQAALVF
jgi:hypothetical protein